MDNNLGLLIHLLTFVLLAAAVFMALRLIRSSGLVLAWLVLPAAFALMALSPLLDLYGHLYQQNHGVIIEASDVLYLLSALLMLAGVFLLRRIVAERGLVQQKLHQQLDELQRFQRVAVGRELRMKELVAENAALRAQLERTKEPEVKS